MIFLLFGILTIFLLCPELVAEGGKNGLVLWATILVPSLLPFSLFVSLLRKKLADSPSRYLILIAGLLSGYPMGAKIAGDMYQEGSLSYRKATFFSGFTNNPSPMFVLIFVAGTNLGLTTQKYLFYALLLLSSCLGSFLYSFFLLPSGKIPPQRTLSQNSTASGKNLLDELDNEISSAAELLIKIGGYIMLFSIITTLIQHCPFLPHHLQLFLCSILEVTTGTVQIADSFLPQHTKIILSLVATTFGGLSSIAQTNGVLQHTGLSSHHYIIIKMLSAILAFLLALLFFGSRNLF